MRSRARAASRAHFSRAWEKKGSRLLGGDDSARVDADLHQSTADPGWQNLGSAALTSLAGVTTERCDGDRSFRRLGGAWTGARWQNLASVKAVYRQLHASVHGLDPTRDPRMGRTRDEERSTPAPRTRARSLGSRCRPVTASNQRQFPMVTTRKGTLPRRVVLASAASRVEPSAPRRRCRRGASTRR